MTCSLRRRMLRDELALKMATVSLISVESSEAQLAALQQVFIAQPNIDTAHFSYLLLASYA